MLVALLTLLVLRVYFGARLEKLSYEWLDGVIRKWEATRYRHLWSALIALGLLGVGCLLIRPDTHCNYLGHWYAEMAQYPFLVFDENPVGYRRLTALISYLLGLRGCNIIITNLLFAAALIYAVFRYFVHHSVRPGDAFFAAVGVAFSLITFTTIHCGGYTDSTTYLLIFLMWWHRGRPWLFYLLLLAGLTNRESVVFLVPWFVLIHWQSRQRSWKTLAEIIVGLAGAFALYYLYRMWLGGQGDYRYTLYYYLEPLTRDPLVRFRVFYYFHTLAWFSVLKLLWVFPLLAIAVAWRDRLYGRLLSYALLLAGAQLQLLPADDTSRMLTLAFMVLPISMIELWQNNEYNVRKWMPWVFLANLAVPQLYTARNIIEIWQPLWRHFMSAVW